MERRFEGYPISGGIYVLDTFTGEVKYNTPNFSDS